MCCCSYACTGRARPLVTQPVSPVQRGNGAHFNLGTTPQPRHDNLCAFAHRRQQASNVACTCAKRDGRQQGTRTSLGQVLGGRVAERNCRRRETLWRGCGWVAGVACFVLAVLGRVPVDRATVADCLHSAGSDGGARNYAYPRPGLCDTADPVQTYGGARREPQLCALPARKRC